MRPDRERASDLGVSIQTIAATPNVLVGGEPVSKYKESDEQYDVWLRAEQRIRDDRESDRPPDGALDRSAGLVRALAASSSLEHAPGPNTIDRFGRQRQVVVSANLEGNAAGRRASANSCRACRIAGPAAGLPLRVHRPGQDAGGVERQLR